MNYKYIFFSVLLVTNLEAFAWINWGKTHSCTGELMAPKTKDELIELVKNASDKNRKIRVVGCGHSGNDIACSNDLLINLSNLDNIYVNSKLKRVKIEGGVTLDKLNQVLFEHDLSLSNLISITEPTVVGAICTASHGTGHTGSLSSFVIEIELITASGDLVCLSIDNDQDAFKSACTSLGALGVIYSVVLQCEPLFKLEYSNFKTTIDELILKHEAFYGNNDFSQFRWNTKDNIITVECWNKVPLETPLSEFCRYSFDTLPCDKGKPYLTSDKKSRESAEIAFDKKYLSEILVIIKDLLVKWKEAGLEIPSFNIRFVNTDVNTFLSPASSDVVYLGMNPATDGCYEDFESKLHEYGGRPHWGKKHSLNYEKALFLYGDNFLKFINVKKRLDPANIFSNEYIDRVFSH